MVDDLYHFVPVGFVVQVYEHAVLGQSDSLQNINITFYLTCYEFVNEAFEKVIVVLYVRWLYF